MAQVKYAGIKINLGGEDLIVPALSAGQAEQFDPEIAAINAAFKETTTSGKTPFALYSRWIPIYCAAIGRNYPEMTELRLRDDVDLSNHIPLQHAVLGIDKDSLTRGE